jgi:hypothetical protein
MKFCSIALWGIFEEHCSQMKFLENWSACSQIEVGEKTHTHTHSMVTSKADFFSYLRRKVG